MTVHDACEQAYKNGYEAARKEFQRPKGRWITWEEAGNDIPSLNRHECSVCHDAAQVLVNGIEDLAPFCPSCGADLREVPA